MRCQTTAAARERSQQATVQTEPVNFGGASWETTIYDPHWDQHLRLLVFAPAAIAKSGFVRRAFLPLFFALERNQCTTIAAAKELMNDAGCLQDVPLQLLLIFKA